MQLLAESASTDTSKDLRRATRKCCSAKMATVTISEEVSKGLAKKLLRVDLKGT